MSDSKTMVSQLEEVFKENINSVEMGVFKREMQRLQTMEVEFVRLREEHKVLTTDYDDLSKILSSYKESIDGIELREKDLNEEEDKMELKKVELTIKESLLELKEKHSNSRVEDHKEMVKLIFRGPVFKKSVIENGTRDEMNPTSINENGSMSYPMRENGLNKNSTITTKEEET